VTGKYREYTKQRCSGQQWLGDVPNEWPAVRLKNLFAIRKDIAGKLGFDVLSVTQRGLKKKDLTSGEGQLSMDYSKYQLVHTGDFVMNHMDLLTGFVDIAEQEGVTSPDYRVFVPRHGTVMDKSYYLYIFQMCYLYRIFYPLGQGSSQLGRWRLPSKSFEEFVLPIPTVKEQTQIAKFLDYETAKIDALIEKQQQLIELLKEKRQAVISHAVTKGLNPDAPMRDSGVEWLGNVPAHWDVVRLRHVADIQSGMPKGKPSSPTSVEMPMLRVANVQDGWLNLDEVHSVPVERDQVPRYLLRPGDVLMNEGGDRDKLGRGTIWRGEIPQCIHQNHVFAIRPYGIEPEWLDAVTRAEYAKFHFFQVAKQSTNLASISSTNIMETPLVVPPSNERAAILKHIDEMQRKIAAAIELAECQSALLQERRTALISAAVTGKIDVRGWRPPVTEADAEVA
jgi:type I restriction enzyme S subunit